jgi:hypothetical protein
MLAVTDDAAVAARWLASQTANRGRPTGRRDRRRVRVEDES